MSSRQTAVPVLPRLLPISSSLFHSHQVRLCSFSIQVSMLLEPFDKCLADCLRHLTRRATNIYNAGLVVEVREDEGRLLADEVLHIDFLPLEKMSVGRRGRGNKIVAHLVSRKGCKDG